ncbi:hypothetical protein [Peribacillus sp. NPDC058075]|uniref:hypothetical protein n=1 Tax=unclassified Peribacillus TaxID=2675266 RepID=UPI0036D8FF44
MSKYWSYKILLTGVFIIATIIFYRFGFISEGLVYFVCLAILLSVLSIFNRKNNYNKDVMLYLHRLMRELGWIQKEGL